MLLFTEAVPPGSAFYIPEERHAEVLEASRGSRTTVMYQYYNPVTVVCKSWTRQAIRGGVFQRFDFTLGFVYVIATLHYARQ